MEFYDSLQKSKPREGLLGCRGALSVRNRLQAVTNFGSPYIYIINLLFSTMTLANQQNLTKPAIDALYLTLSKERLSTYLYAAGYNQDRALRLYMWNAQVGEAFHIPIQSVEVGLRNRINAALIAEFGPDWWCNDKFKNLADKERLADLDQTLRRIRNRNLKLYTGQVVAGLSFGFWVGMLHRQYNPPIWGAHLRMAFPHLPKTRARQSLAKSAARTAYIRNRIWHHEPIIKENLSEDYGLIMTLLEWICPTKLDWIRPHCRVPELLRQKP